MCRKRRSGSQISDQPQTETTLTLHPAHRPWCCGEKRADSGVEHAQGHVARLLDAAGHGGAGTPTHCPAFPRGAPITALSSALRLGSGAAGRLDRSIGLEAIDRSGIGARSPRQTMRHKRSVCLAAWGFTNTSNTVAALGALGHRPSRPAALLAAAAVACFSAAISASSARFLRARASRWSGGGDV